MTVRTVLLLIVTYSLFNRAIAQCGSPIASFPYTEDFETNDGGWVSGGPGNDWAWGTPIKPVISGAGNGNKCWITGGLNNSSYTSAEASWLLGPCFDFSSLQYPYIEFKVFWETEQQFDGGSLQYSIDNGATWNPVGSVSDPVNCLNSSWFNYSPINYLSPLSSSRDGWSGNIQSTAGSCRGGNGSNGWVTAKHTMPSLAGRPSVIFRFIFGAGTVCNNYDGFAIDAIKIGEAPANDASFNYTCNPGNSVLFSNSSVLCPTGFAWNFDDPASGANNLSNLEDPTHVFSGPGTYMVKLTVSGPGNAPSTIMRPVTILGLTTAIISPANCTSGMGGSARVDVSGGTGPFSYNWNTVPPQFTSIATGLGNQSYTVSVEADNSCPATSTITIPLEPGCSGIYFPSAFTPNNDGKNEGFGALGSLGSLIEYELDVYGRWGQRVFHTKSPFEKWDGRTKGHAMDANVFAWRVRYRLQGGQQETRKGIVIIVR